MSLKNVFRETHKTYCIVLSKSASYSTNNARDVYKCHTKFVLVLFLRKIKKIRKKNVG